MSELVSTVTAAGVALLQCAPLRDRGVPHGFTLRTSSFGARGSGESDRKKLSEALGLERIAFMRQVHGNEVVPSHGPRAVSGRHDELVREWSSLARDRCAVRAEAFRDWSVTFRRVLWKLSPVGLTPGVVPGTEVHIDHSQ